MHNRALWLLSLVSLFALCGCISLPAPDEAIPTHEVRASTGTHERMVIVLPGRGDDLEGLEQSGIAAAIQQAMPDADVVLVEATLRYYMAGNLPARLHEQVIEPAQRRGYREVWLAGASMGGYGVMMYEHEHAGLAIGLVLMAPFMGSRSLLEEIHEAGGLAKWDPGPKPAALVRDNADREQWRTVKGWLTNPARAQKVWVICGSEDNLKPATDLIATALPKQNVLTPPGGHKWVVWAPAAREALERASAPGPRNDLSQRAQRPPRQESD